ncbi:hypothetical protein ACFC96_43745 [Streptomyces sp. NPDC055955]|uniref:hypothetical protein n=1 Tax=Streptomyces sp. NPDC055955 TaxID=3345665 RepID=UPI0035E330BC
MSEVLIGFSAAARRRYWWRGAIVMVMFASGTVAVGLTAPASERWWWVGGFGAFVLAVGFDMINRIYGRAALTTAGIEFRTIASRRSIPWNEIVGIEEKSRASRSGLWHYLQVVRIKDRSLMIPGTLTNRMWDAELDHKRVLIQEHWSRALTD